MTRMYGECMVIDVDNAGDNTASAHISFPFGYNMDDDDCMNAMITRNGNDEDGCIFNDHADDRPP